MPPIPKRKGKPLEPPVKKPVRRVCRACEGSGKSSTGLVCYPCQGRGSK